MSAAQRRCNRVLSVPLSCRALRAPSILRSRAAIAVASITLATLALLAPARAFGANAFYLDNETGAPLNAQIYEMPNCWYGPTGIFIPSDHAWDGGGSIRSEATPFHGCEQYYTARLGYGWKHVGSYERDGFVTHLWKGGMGMFDFTASNPTVGRASVGCSNYPEGWVIGNGYRPIDRLMAAEVDGLHCRISWLPGMRPTRALGALGLSTALDLADAPPSNLRFTNSLADVRDGVAEVEVATYGRDQSVDARVTLRDDAGELLGEGEEEVRLAGGGALVAVPLDDPVRAVLGRDGEAVVEAVVDQAGGEPGTGDSTSQLILRAADAG